jgi:hypothetical protein
MKTLGSSVRPLVTYLFVLAQIGLAVGWALGLPKAEPAFAALAAFTMMIVKDYFDSRKALQVQEQAPTETGSIQGATSTFGMK